MSMQNGRTTHSALTKRVDVLEDVLAPVRERDAQEAALASVWQSWPLPLRCWLATTDFADVRATYLLEHVVGLALEDLRRRKSLVPIAAAILREAVELETWRLIFAHDPPRVWSYGCPERQQAAQTLVGMDAAELHALDDDELLSAWVRHAAAPSDDELSPRGENYSDVRNSAQLEPAALLVLEAAYTAGRVDECPHADGHDQVPRHVGDELERALSRAP